MEFVEKPISEIETATYNPRVDLTPDDPDYHRIKNSLTRFGSVVPLVWNKRTNRLVGGHQRLKIFKERGDQTTYVSVVDLPEDEERALNIALNNSHGRNDDAKLVALLEEIQAVDPDLAVDAGFDENRLAELMADVAEPDSPDQGTQGAEPAPSLTERFLVAPMSVIDTREALWKERQHGWESIIPDGTTIDPALAEVMVLWFSRADAMVMDATGEPGMGEIVARLHRGYSIPVREGEFDLVTLWATGSVRTEWEALYPLLKNAVERLRNDRFLVVVVDPVIDYQRGGRILSGMVADECGSSGVYPHAEIQIITPAGAEAMHAGRKFTLKRQVGITHQTMLVFCKGDPTAATLAAGAVEIPEAG